MKTRTPEEIQRQINGLQAMKDWLPERNAFGDHNWGKIDAQVEILNGQVSMEEMEEDFDELDQGEPDEIYNAAQEADNWLQGESDEDLFETR